MVQRPGWQSAEHQPALKPVCPPGRLPGRVSLLLACLSELQAHRELNDTRATADQTCRRAHCCCHGASNRRSDLTEVSAAGISRRVGKIGVVEEIEEVRPELKTKSLGAEGE